MKWFKKKKSKSADQDQNSGLGNLTRVVTTPRASALSSQLLAQLPSTLLERIFSLVCPHTQDETYETCEQSAAEDACMLCDLRDLAHCVQVSKRWRAFASNVMYHSIRIDSVHYCDREDILAEKRKRRSFMNRNAEPENVPEMRLRLLCRTLRDDQGGVALKVQYLKIPYMIRETCKADLARTVAVLPYLRYVDLPERLFIDEQNCGALKQEVQVRCPDLRKMTYPGGAERSLELLSSGQVWRNLEVLELLRLNMDPTILRQVLGYLPQLHALKVTDMKTFNDELFQPNTYLPPFPPLKELIFDNIPNVTAEGLATYLFRTDTQDALKTLSLTSTGVHPSTLQQILGSAPHLTKLSIIESPSASFPATQNVKLLQSQSLEIFHYEITTVQSPNSYSNTSASYYSYLTSSLMSGGLPSLKQLYVRDPNFPESLLDLAPPAPAFASDPDAFVPPNPFGSPGRANPRLSSNNPFAEMASGPGLKQELVVYSKGLDEMEWNFSKVQPSQRGRRGSATAPRPISSYGLSESMGKSWGQGAGARSSVMVGNGFGGFLAVPADGEGRPSTSSGEHGRRRGSQYDMWR